MKNLRSLSSIRNWPVPGYVTETLTSAVFLLITEIGQLSLNYMNSLKSKGLNGAINFFQALIFRRKKIREIYSTNRRYIKMKLTRNEYSLSAIFQDFGLRTDKFRETLSNCKRSRVYFAKFHEENNENQLTLCFS